MPEDVAPEGADAEDHERPPEARALLAVHGHIDEAVARSPEAARQIAQLFPCYSSEAVGWTREFEQMLRDAGKIESDESAFPKLDEGLAHLAENEPQHAWHGARRMQTLSALMRVSPRHAHGGEDAELVTAALGHHTRGGEGKALHRRLSDADLTHDTWHIGVENMVESGELHQRYLDVAPPCSGDLVPVTLNGETEPVTVLSTVYHHPDFVPADLWDTVLNPESWPGCDPFWCVMKREPNQTGTYLDDITTFLEEVAGECSGWRIKTRLDCRRRSYGNGSRSLDYWLAADQTDPCDGLVEVDEGSILVEPTGPTGVRVSTTKRLRFRGPMNGAQLAMTACALGWDGAGEQFVFGCTSPSGGQPSSTTATANT